MTQSPHDEPIECGLYLSCFNPDHR